MQLTIFDTDAENNPPSSFGRTSPECLARLTMPSVVFSRNLSANQHRSPHRASGGQTLVLSLDPGEVQRGEFLTLNTSDWPNDANVWSLSDILETGNLPPRFYLSATACKGILRRAEKRGKTLPPALQEALVAVAHATPTLTDAAPTFPKSLEL